MSNTSKHAYLILAHEHSLLLELLLQALDHTRNDIYLHFDKKMGDIPPLSVKNATLSVLSRRVDVRWGDVSVVEAEMNLFEEALSSGNIYVHLHLLSGVDLPLHSQTRIHSFFDKHPDKEFIGYSQYNYQSEVERKIERYHLYPKYFRSRCPWFRFWRALFLRLQIWSGWKRDNHLLPLKKGTQWVSITPQFAHYVISHRSSVLRDYAHTFCADEVVLHTLCWHSQQFRQRIFDVTDESVGCQRLIGWRNGRIYDWTINDLPKLESSTAMFARKFSMSCIDVAKHIVQRIKNEE